jgi:magnesium-transporting ATPase (P-type)
LDSSGADRGVVSLPNGLSDREVARKLEVVGPNELPVRQGSQWPAELARQLTHPLALLLWMAAGLRGGVATNAPTSELVPGDVLLLEEGERIPDDARLLRGAVEVDASALTGESVRVERSAEAIDTADRRLDSQVLVFSGTSGVTGSAVTVVHATGRHTEIRRIDLQCSRKRLV